MTQQREEQDKALQALRARLTEINKTWADTREDEAKRKEVLAELEALEKSVGGVMTPADRKALEYLAGLLFKPEPKSK
jgi:hypothetical protein